MEETNENREIAVSENQDMQSKSITSLVKSLIKFQSEVKDISKDKVNPFFNSKYADINNIIQSIRKTLTSNDLAISQGNRYCIDSNGFYIVTTLYHSSGEWLRSELRMPIGGKKDAQAVGASVTYGRRYGLLSILGISVDGDDDDGNLSTNKQQ